MRRTALALLISLWAVPVLAADLAVSVAGAGAANGTDWDNACAGFTGACAMASLVRGNTYYIADGDYLSSGALTFNKAVSGTTLIIIRKATVASHGPATGWLDTMGDGESVFDTLWFLTSYWNVDGQVGSGTSGFGFRIDVQTCDGAGGLGSQGLLFGSNTTGHEASYFEVDHCGEDWLRDGTQGAEPCSPSGSCGFAGGGVYNCNTTPQSGLHLHHFYIHDLTANPITLCKVTDGLIEHGRFERLHGVDAGLHGQAIQLTAPPMNNITIRYNVFADIAGTAAIAFLGNDETYEDMFIYGNLFYSTDSVRYTYSPNAIYGRDSNTQVGFLVYNNTFYNVIKPRTGLWGTVSDSESRNNVYVNSEFSDNPPTSGITYSHNFYYNNTGSFIPSSETAQQNGSVDPFVNAGALNFALVAATSAGTTLASPYDVDATGVIRGADGYWDRGFSEFTGGAPPGSGHRGRFRR